MEKLSPAMGFFDTIFHARRNYFIHIDSDEACEALLPEQLNKKILASSCDLILTVMGDFCTLSSWNCQLSF